MATNRRTGLVHVLCIPFYLLFAILFLFIIWPIQMCREMRLPRLKRDKPKINKYDVNNDGVDDSWLGCASCMYHRLCCMLNFRPVALSEAIERYSERKPKPLEELLIELTKNEIIGTILDAINKHKPHFFFKILPSGSIRERFGKSLPSTSILATDFDLMLVPDGIEVKDAEEDDDERFPHVFKVVDDPRENTTPAGYVWLQLVESSLKHWYNLSYQRTTKNGIQSFLSQLAVYQMIETTVLTDTNVLKLLKRKLKDGQVSVKRSGPATTFVFTKQTSKKACICAKAVTREEEVCHVDFTLALYCPKFPRRAMGFFQKHQGDSQKDYPWPNQMVVDKIANIGCHVVPKPSSKSLTFFTPEQKTDSYLANWTALEWRYSFSQAEMILSDYLPPQARTAFLAFKSLIKMRINTVVQQSGNIVEIPSYVLKTILLKATERKPISYWVDGVEAEFFQTLLSELINCVEEESCQMYWIEEINLLDGVFSGDPNSQQYILDVLKRIAERPNRYLVDNWLEYQRFIRLNCCTCLFPAKPAMTVVTVEQDLETCGCCSIPCSYTSDTCCCGPVSPDFQFFHEY